MNEESEEIVQKQMTISEMIQETCDTVCNELCKYSKTFDNDAECEYIREHGDCPLNKYF